MEVPYMQAYKDYKIAVIPINGKYDVQFMTGSAGVGKSIEICESEHHAVEGAKKFPIFYELAIKNGFRISHIDFKHNDGREVHLSYAMDLDMTPELFQKLLDRGA